MRGFFRHAVGRAVQIIPLLAGVLIVNFVIIHAAPGDPVYALVGNYPVPDSYYKEMRHNFGLDRPLPVQLAIYLERVAQGDLGYSFAQRQSVLDVILHRLGPTVLLVGTAWALAGVVGIAMGVASSLAPYSARDHFVTGFAILGYSIPVFWLGQILILLFAIGIGWLPAQGMTSAREDYTGLAHVLDVGRHLILPAIALSLQFLAVNARLTRNSMLDVLRRDYITTGRSKGLRESTIIVRHALLNALLPVVTIMGFNLGFLFTGSSLVETVFGWPGIGRLLFDSVSTRDYPVLLGIFFGSTVMVFLANFITDTAYALLDPRVRYQ